MESNDCKTFNYGDAVVVLCQNLHGAYYDVPGVYQRLIVSGRDRGRHKVLYNGTMLHVTGERLALASSYFQAFHKNKADLPAGSTGRLHSIEYVESDGGRGRLLPEILKKRGDNEDEKK